jgi:hypothetical protein
MPSGLLQNLQSPLFECGEWAPARIFASSGLTATARTRTSAVRGRRRAAGWTRHGAHSGPPPNCRITTAVICFRSGFRGITRASTRNKPSRLVTRLPAGKATRESWGGKALSKGSIVFSYSVTLSHSARLKTVAGKLPKRSPCNAAEKNPSWRDMKSARGAHAMINPWTIWGGPMTSKRL